MNRNRMAVVTAGVLTAGLLLGSGPSAHAGKVTAKDVPGKPAIVKIFPKLAQGEVHRLAGVDFGMPSKHCGLDDPVTARSMRTIAIEGPKDSGVRVVVAELKSVKQATKVFRAHQRFLKRCAKFGIGGDAVMRLKRINVLPVVGHDRLGFVQIESGGHLADPSGPHVNYTSTIVIRDGKRIAIALAGRQDAKVSKKRIKALSRVTAKKMK